MADIGVLNLTIKDNSEQAAEGLDKLTDALNRVKRAVEGGIKLSSVATSIKNIGKVIDDNIHGSTIVKIGQIADELSKLKGLGNINIKINGGSSIKSVVDSIREADAAMGGINTGFDNFGARAYGARGGLDGFNDSMRETAELMKNTDWSGGLNQFREMFEQMDRVRSMFTLPAGEQTGLSTEVENGWTEWKNGAIEVEGTVTDAMGNVVARLGEPIQYLTGMASQVGSLNDCLGQTNTLMEDMARATSPMSSGEYAIIPYGKNLEDSWEHICDVAERAKPALQEMTKETNAYTGSVNEAERATKAYYESLEDMFHGIRNGRKVENDLLSRWLHGKGTAKEQDYAVKTASKMFGMPAEDVRSRVQEMLAQEQAVPDTQSAGGVSKMFQNLRSSLGTVRESVRNAGGAFGILKKSVSSLFSWLGKLGKQFVGIARRMAIRAIIKQVSQAFSEGVNNVREYSRAIGSSFAKDMDNASAALATMRNSLGAAVAPAIQAVIPILNAVTSAAINAFNWVNQLISLLTGKSSWTRATEGANDFAEAAKGAGGAASEWLAAWDELNVMNSGGGGGGGGAGADQYAEMFEEVYAFDGKIREIAEFLRDNAEEIKKAAIETGIAIAAWKLGNAFAETLPMLSTILGYVGTAASIALTVTLDWMLINQYLDTGKEGWLWASVLTTAVGTTAAYTIAKRLIGGNAGYYAASITLALTALTDIVANVKNTDVDALSKESLGTNIKAALEMGGAAGVILGTVGGWGFAPALLAAGGVALFTFVVATGLKLITQKENIKWGNISLTIDQIEDFVGNTMFVGNPKVQIKLISENVSVGKTERDNIEQKLAEITGTMMVIKLGLNNTESFKKLKEQVEGLIANMQSYINNAKETGTLTLQFTPTLVGATEEERTQWFSSYTTGWNTVNEFYEKKGKEIADLLVENEKGEIIAKNPELLQTLMTSLSEVTSAVTEAGIVSEAEAKMRLGLGDLTKATGDQVLALFTQYKKDLTDSYTELVQEQYKKQGELVAALGKIDPNSQEYKDALEEYRRMGENLTKAVEDGVNANIEPGKNMIMEWLLGNHGQGSINWYGETETLTEWLNTEGLADTIYTILKTSGFDQQELDVMELVGISGWDFFAEDLKKKFLENVEIDEETIKQLQAVGIPAKDLVKFVKWDKVKNMGQDGIIKAITDAYGPSGISAIKSEFPNITASDIVKVINWSTFSTEQKFEFLNAIKGAFGSKEAITAARKAGIDIGDLVKQGMQSKDPLIRGQAAEWDKIINDELKSSHTISVQMSSSAVSSAASIVKNTIEGLNPTVTATAKYASGYPQNLKTAAEAQKPVLTATVVLANGAAGAVQSAIEALKPEITVTPKTGDLTSFKNAIKSAITGAINGVSAFINGSKLNIEARAEGGLVKSGDLFMANENGNSEMIGKFGSHTAVANQEQMVEAMARGVQYANAEQNSLLRRQNELLMAILQKESSVRLSASSALGRVAKQSIGMYETATGV